MISALMNSPRKGLGRPSVLLDMRPLQGPSAGRGVGAYARGLLQGLVRAGFDSNLTLLLGRADLLIAVSNATAEDARRLRMAAPGRIRVIPEAASPVFAPRQGAAARIKDRWSLGGSYLLFVGALDARKDPRALLQAWR